MKKYLNLIRAKHWIKNILVFLPLFFNGSIFKLKLLSLNLLAFIIFCLSSTVVYIINDINDIDNDRKHAIKKNRPLANKSISIKSALIIAIIFFILSIIVISYLYLNTKRIGVIIIPIIYIIINILYSKILKQIPIIDILVLVSGFVLRVLYGGIVVNISLSKYLYLMIIFGAYYLGFGKRRNEIKNNGNASRSVLTKYNESFLDKNMYVSYALSVVTYTMWCVDTEVTSKLGHDYLFLTIPILMTILQLYSLNIEDDSSGDPVDVILSNKLLLGVGIIYLITIIILIYFI